MTTLVATYTAGTFKVDLFFREIGRSAQGRCYTTHDGQSGITKCLSHTGGLHIAVLNIGGSFTYKLILVLSKRARLTGTIRTPHHAETIRIDFPEVRGRRKIDVSSEPLQQTGVLSVDDCYVWFYIPLEGVKAPGDLLHAARYCALHKMAQYSGHLPRPDMQDEILVTMISYILSQLSPPQALTMLNPSKRELRPDFLRYRSAGLLRELASFGSWIDLLRPDEWEDRAATYSQYVC